MRIQNITVKNLLRRQLIVAALLISTTLLRGGSWYWRALLCRTADRVNFIPITSENSIGFRCVLSKAQ